MEDQKAVATSDEEAASDMTNLLMEIFKKHKRLVTVYIMVGGSLSHLDCLHTKPFKLASCISNLEVYTKYLIYQSPSFHEWHDFVFTVHLKFGPVESKTSYWFVSVIP